MKIILIHDTEGNPYATLRPDTVLLRNNDNFYMPYGDPEMECEIGIAVHITKMTKYVDEKFASKCYDRVGLAAAFTNITLRDRRLKDSLPCEEAYSFDHSLAVAPEFSDPERFSSSEITYIIGHGSGTLQAGKLAGLLAKAISYASRVVTFRTGDMVLVMSGIKQNVRPGDTVTVSAGEGLSSMDFEVR